MNSKDLEDFKLEIANIQKEIEKAKEKQSKYQEKLENAVSAEKPADIRADIKALLDSATQELNRLGQELHDLRQKEGKLFEERRGINEKGIY